MKIYNTLTKSVETITSISNEKRIGFYACGPTVYDRAHIGHLRKYTSDDIFIRTLQKAGFEVRHVMNITDVGHLVTDADTGDDKMEKAARAKKMKAKDLAVFYEEDFWGNIDTMGLQRPDVICRATEHIDQQIAQVKKLEEKGFTYVIPNDGLYFDTSKDNHYGELANLKLDDLKEGARIGTVEGKRHPSDFALWKFSPKDEQRQMEWDSPWGVGFPGWHIECSAMSMKYLGDQFEIHTGGIDHIPVHHTNEIAQAEGATGKHPFVRYWVHYNFLRVEGQKMSKSLKNFLTLSDLVEKGFSPMALKMLFLTAQYGDELNFTWNALQGSQKGYERLQRKMTDLLQQAQIQTLINVPDYQMENMALETQKIMQQFVAFMEDNLKTPQALALMWKLVKKAQPEDLPALKEMTQYFGLEV